MIAEDGKYADDLDYIIELSVLKIRRMQISGAKEERQRLLVLETLHRAIAQKIETMEADDSISMDRTATFLTILHEAVRRLGLNRLVRFSISLPDNTSDLPRLKVPSARRTRDNNNMLMEIPVTKDSGDYKELLEI
jgi:hypothetical protein